MASERLAVAFRVVLAEFCCPERPLIILVDDIQWADPSSLDLLAMLANNNDISNLLIVGCFRDDEQAHIN
ncbi:Protein kinase domain [Seminavis robusta]|uniref:Protein kinase domain n=1 Tax=Seminavis robusta TaxID=568900 RepID=A0A9N8EV65_9STRA|nr:Protein kinase domain [Seminavis robusta]|eukprot:Sro1774_g296770.1 Protein kinase domain (70) ;mRNA; r:6522-6805